MPNYDLSSADLGRVAGQLVDKLRIANQDVWTASGPPPDGPYYLNDAAGVTPGGFSDGTPNIVIGLLTIFHNPGYVTGLQWWDQSSGAGNWDFGFYEVTTSDGSKPDTGTSKLASATLAATGGGFREVTFTTPVPVSYGHMYLATRYNANGYYVHSGAFGGNHGAFTDGDPVYIPAIGEDVSPVVPTWTNVWRSLFKIGSGDVVPNENGAGAFYGVTPIFFKTL
jgi:hypothetical protein